MRKLSIGDKLEYFFNNEWSCLLGAIMKIAEDFARKYFLGDKIGLLSSPFELAKSALALTAFFLARGGDLSNSN